MDLLQSVILALLGDTPIERVIIAGMGFGLVWQQRILNRVQEKRVEDAMRIAAAAHTFAAALERNTETLRSLGE